MLCMYFLQSQIRSQFSLLLLMGMLFKVICRMGSDCSSTRASGLVIGLTVNNTVMAQAKKSDIGSISI